MKKENKEIKVVIEKVVDKVLSETKKKLEDDKKIKLQEQKRIAEEMKKINKFKTSLHEMLSPIDWENLSLKESEELIIKFEAWLKENKGE